MNSEWVILVWALVSVIFLAKIPSVREFFAKVRKISAIGIICMMLSLGFLAKVSYTKDSVKTNQSTNQTISLSAETTVLASAGDDDVQLWKAQIKAKYAARHNPDGNFLDTGDGSFVLFLVKQSWWCLRQWKDQFRLAWESGCRHLRRKMHRHMQALLVEIR